MTMSKPERLLPEGLKPAIKALAGFLPRETMYTLRSGIAGFLPRETMYTLRSGIAIPLREFLARNQQTSLLEHCEGVLVDVKRTEKRHILAFICAHMRYIYSRISPCEMDQEEFQIADAVLPRIRRICIDKAIAIANNRGHKILAIIFELEKMIRDITYQRS